MNAIAPVERLTRDLATAAKTLSDQEARFLVDAYYMMQEDRKRANNQVRALGENAEPHSVLQWLAQQSETLEKQILRALDKYTQAHPVGEWLRNVHGIGPVLAACLLSHIDIDKAPTAGHIWAFAGMDPTKKWGKGQKRPWNATLKSKCWLIGQSFMKLSNNEDCYYGCTIYKSRKRYEQERNVPGNPEIADAVAEGLAKVGKHTEAYKHYSSGVLPPAQIDARARRYAVKRFLLDLHTAWLWIEKKQLAPVPYPIAHLGHAHHELPPVFDTLPDLVAELRKQGARPAQ